MITIADIKKPIEKELSRFNEEFDKSLTSDNETLSIVHQHIKNNKGKQIRPTMTLLSAKICNKEISDSSIYVALALELLHTASLVHDDVVDDSKMRRGQSSVNAIWDNQVSVLTGDYLLSEALNTACKTNNIQIIKNICDLGKRLSEGELLQINNVEKVSTIEEKYIEVISKKTAKLFSVCTQNGAISVNASDEKINAMKSFGELYGIAFQIRDDIFDYISTKETIGKPVGNDIREGKITLPLIYALNNCEPVEKQVIMNIIKQKDFTTDNINEIIEFAKKKGGIEYAEQRLDYYSDKAIECLNIFEDSDMKDSLVNIVNFSRIRKN